MTEFRFRRFKTIDGDIDSNTSIRQFSGRLTKGRYQKLSRLARKLSVSLGHCGHDFDCCGCLHDQTAEVDYKKNLVTFKITQSFNY